MGNNITLTFFDNEFLPFLNFFTLNFKGYLHKGIYQSALSSEHRQQILQQGYEVGNSGLRGIFFCVWLLNIILTISLIVIAMACGKDMNSLFYAGMVGINGKDTLIC